MAPKKTPVVAVKKEPSSSGASTSGVSFAPDTKMEETGG
jgi:hypothetical protein